MGKTFDLIQVGCHIGNTLNDRKTIGLFDIKSNAIFVEPIKRFYDLMVKNHNRDYPSNKFIFLNKACSNKVGELELYEPDIITFSRETEPEYIERALPNWIDQLTSVYPDHVSNHHLSINTKLVKVPCITLNQLIHEYEITELKSLVIDTEGHDFEILNDLDLNLLRPKKIIFEHKHMEGTNKIVGEKYDTILNKLFSFGYVKTHMDTEDTYLELI